MLLLPFHPKSHALLGVIYALRLFYAPSKGFFTRRLTSAVDAYRVTVSLHRFTGFRRFTGRYGWAFLVSVRKFIHALRFATPNGEILMTSNLRFCSLRFLGIALVWFVASNTTLGALTHYVPFDEGYTAGGDLNGSGGMDLGFQPQTWFDGAAAGAGSMVIAGNLSAPAGLPVAGNSATTPASDFNLAFYTFDDGIGGAGEPGFDNLPTGEHWISFLARADASSDFGGLSLKRFFGDEILYIGKVGGAGGTEWGVDPQNGLGQFAVEGSDATVDTFLVARLTLGPAADDDTVDLFINPTPGGPAPTTPDLTVGFNENPVDGVRQIDELRIGSQAGAFAVDEIRIGATFADVAPGGGLLLGDYDRDGDVDQGDYTKWVTDFGMTDSTADGNNDGVVDAADYTIWRDNLTSSASIDSATQIPEPSTIVLTGLVMLLLFNRRRL